ncbi:MAG: hypothetical protein FJW32_07225 [Acidobacteria bacterium]|nr:hypothetical protein [Acidobacteriota bacterium]
MPQPEISPEDLRKLLLGQMPRADRARIEARRNSDSALDDAIDLAESLLIDDYVEKQLSAEETEAFKSFFLTTEDRKQRLALSRGIHKLSAQEHSRKLWRIGAAVAVVAVLMGVVLYQRSNAVQTVRLPVNNTKSGEQIVLHLAEAPATIVLEFDCPRVPPTHTLTFGRLGDPKPLITQRIESSTSAIVKLPLQKSMLPPGDYLAILSAGQEFRADFRLIVAP